LSDFSESIEIKFAVKPDAPINLLDQGSNDQRIKLSWSEGLSNGGAQIIEYTVFTLEGSEFIELATVTDNSLTVADVTFG
jgi:hypothetical protein